MSTGNRYFCWRQLKQFTVDQDTKPEELLRPVIFPLLPTQEFLFVMGTMVAVDLVKLGSLNPSEVIEISNPDGLQGEEDQFKKEKFDRRSQ